MSFEVKPSSDNLARINSEIFKNNIEARRNERLGSELLLLLELEEAIREAVSLEGEAALSRHKGIVDNHNRIRNI